MKRELRYQLPNGFRTSINVLNRVLNIPSSTIEHELKKHNYTFYDQSSNCIDEEMLDFFAEKFCKKLKRYFERSLQEYETLSLEESKEFHEFVRTYSKYGRFPRKWRDIDKGAIKEDFLRQVVELASRERERKKAESEAALLEYAKSVICSCCDKSLRVIDATDSHLQNNFSHFEDYDLVYHHDFVNEIDYYTNSVSDSTVEDTRQDGFRDRVILVDKIKHSRLYLSRPSRKFHSRKFVPIFERIYVSARFHIVSDDGTDDEINYMNTLPIHIININYQHNDKYQKQEGERRQFASKPQDLFMVA